MFLDVLKALLFGIVDMFLDVLKALLFPVCVGPFVISFAPSDVFSFRASLPRKSLVISVVSLFLLFWD